MVTAFSTFAEALLYPSPDLLALLLRPRLQQLESLMSNTNLEGEWTSNFSKRSTTNPSEGKMEKNHSKPWDLHHTRTWVPALTPAHLRTWPTLCLYPGDQEGQYGVRSCQSLAHPEVCPAYVKDPHLPEPTYGALDRTA